MPLSPMVRREYEQLSDSDSGKSDTKLHSDLESLRKLFVKSGKKKLIKELAKPNTTKNNSHEMTKPSLSSAIASHQL